MQGVKFSLLFARPRGAEIVGEFDGAGLELPFQDYFDMTSRKSPEFKFKYQESAIRTAKPAKLQKLCTLRFD